MKPIVEPPGAGLPWAELKLAGLMFGAFRRLTPRSAVSTLFRQETARILELARQPEEVLSRRVLISRLRGMEDSSRDWSVLMTLDHLRIVNGQMLGVIHSLAAGRVPDRVASTAAVKPSPDVAAGVRDDYAAGAEEFLKETAALEDLKTSARFKHPWFGPLDAAGWHAMAAVHQRLHRRQIESILRDAAVTS